MSSIDPKGLFTEPLDYNTMLKTTILTLSRFRSAGTSLRSANNLLKANKIVGKFTDVMDVCVLGVSGYYNYKYRMFSQKGTKAEVITSEVSAQAINGIIHAVWQNPLGVKGLLQASFWINKNLASSKADKQGWIRFEKEFWEGYGEMYKDISGDTVLKYLRKIVK
ncbi:MAG: hypothetical protein Q8M92_01085 [Candidatus Subteraquimicrobiales bacterium]|nr:hypothetical protein [Candidatus Subteraquimicrobiales bacterium]